MPKRNTVLTWEAIYDVTDIADYIESEFSAERADKFQEEIKRLEELEKNSKDDSGNKGCLWFIIIACALGALFTYLSDKMWFPF